jgi:hypothetical protein
LSLSGQRYEASAAVYALCIGRLRIASFATAIATTVPRERLGAPALVMA